MTQFKRLRTKESTINRDRGLVLLIAVLGYPALNLSFSNVLSQNTLIWVYIGITVIGLILTLFSYGKIEDVCFYDDKKVIELKSFNILNKARITRLSYDEAKFENLYSRHHYIHLTGNTVSEGINREAVGQDQYRQIIEKLESIGAEWLNKGYLKVD